MSSKKEIFRIINKLKYIFSITKFILRGYGKQKCACCGFEGAFDTVGSPPRYGAQCPKCGSYERHRLLTLADEKYNYFQGKRVLHFAPEPVISTLVKQKAVRYATADIIEGQADLILNIEDIAESDNQWDVILCSHVLEHVDDDKALSELYRILSNHGVLIVMVPMINGWDFSYENKNITTGLEREIHFGQRDHVRYYGRDIRQRILSKGFKLEEYTAFGEEAIIYGLLKGEKVFICQKHEI